MITSRKQNGQAITEYLIGATVALALVVGMAGRPSALDALVNAVHRGFARFDVALSLPIAP